VSNNNQTDRRALFGSTQRFLAAAALIFGVIGAAGTAQEKKPYPIFTSEQFVAAMKTVGQAFTAVNGALARNEVDDGKAYLAITRDRLATTITFWRDRHAEDAVRMLRTALAKLDELDAALSADALDRSKVTDLAKQAETACDACHATYRNQDPETKEYRFKPGIDR
jgi:cytochrome c556